MAVEKSDLVTAKNPLILQYAFYPDAVQSHLDLGSRYGGTLQGLKHPVVPLEPYHHGANLLRQHPEYPEVIEKDAVEFLELCVKTGRKFEVITGFDFIEHLPRQRSLHLLEMAEIVATRALIWFLPEENDEIRARPDFIERREEAYHIHVPADHMELYSHKSDWVPSDFDALDYNTNFLPNFHMIGVGAFFASKYFAELDRRFAMERQVAEPLLWWGERDSSTGKASQIDPPVLPWIKSPRKARR